MGEYMGAAARIPSSLPLAQRSDALVPSAADFEDSVGGDVLPDLAGWVLSPPLDSDHQQDQQPMRRGRRPPPPLTLDAAPATVRNPSLQSVPLVHAPGQTSAFS